jgi:hypothetical protein
MTIDEFAGKLSELSQAAQRRVVRAGMEKLYRDIPIRDLKRIYEKHRNINFDTPSDPLGLVIVAFGFVELEIVRRLKELYFNSLNNPSTWPAVVDRSAKLAHELETEIVTEMEQAFARTRPVP